MTLNHLRTILMRRELDGTEFTVVDPVSNRITFAEADPA
jgi:hypothetical protein